MFRRKEPAIPNELLDQLLAGDDAGAALAQGGLLAALKKTLTERALNAELDHHLAGNDGAGNSGLSDSPPEIALIHLPARSGAIRASWDIGSQRHR